MSFCLIEILYQLIRKPKTNTSNTLTDNFTLLEYDTTGLQSADQNKQNIFTLICLEFDCCAFVFTFLRVLTIDYNAASYGTCHVSSDDQIDKIFDIYHGTGYKLTYFLLMFLFIYFNM